MPRHQREERWGIIYDYCSSIVSRYLGSTLGGAMGIALYCPKEAREQIRFREGRFYDRWRRRAESFEEPWLNLRSRDALPSAAESIIRDICHCVVDKARPSVSHSLHIPSQFFVRDVPLLALRALVCSGTWTMGSIYTGPTGCLSLSDPLLTWS